MAARNRLFAAPPYVVERALKRLGGNLRMARVRRGMTIEDAGSRIGTGPRAVMDAEKGKASTGIAVYAALLWLFDLFQPFEDLADPSMDEDGLALAMAREPTRPRKRGGLDNDF